jgi:hypothetical protein
VVAVVGLLFMSTGTAFAMPVAGIGGFTIQADGIVGEGLILYPGAGAAENSTGVTGSQFESTQDAYPQSVVELDRVAIQGLQLQKVFDLENITQAQGIGTLIPGKARLVIGANGVVQADTLMLKTPQIAADNATFSGLTIQENPTEGPNDITQWLQLRSNDDPASPLPETGANVPTNELYKNYTGANSSEYGLVLNNPYIRSTYLATNQIQIPGLALEVQYDPDNDGDYEWAS